jgi:hypothetical protein
MDLLYWSEVDIESLPLDSFDDSDCVEECDDENELQEIDEDTFKESQSSRKKRAVNYTKTKAIAWCEHGPMCQSMKWARVTKLGGMVVLVEMIRQAAVPVEATTRTLALFDLRVNGVAVLLCEI